MILGIAFFSYIMGNFNDVLINYEKEMGLTDKGSDLKYAFEFLKASPKTLILKQELSKFEIHFLSFIINHNST